MDTRILEIDLGRLICTPFAFAADATDEVAAQTYVLDTIPQSDDAIYRRIQQPLGLLRFDVNVPAKSFGGDAVDILYSYTVEFDRNRRVMVQEPSREEGAMLDIQMPGDMGGGMGSEH